MKTIYHLRATQDTFLSSATYVYEQYFESLADAHNKKWEIKGMYTLIEINAVTLVESSLSVEQIIGDIKHILVDETANLFLVSKEALLIAERSAQDEAFDGEVYADEWQNFAERVRHYANRDITYDMLIEGEASPRVIYRKGDRLFWNDTDELWSSEELYPLWYLNPEWIKTTIRRRYWYGVLKHDCSNYEAVNLAIQYTGEPVVIHKGTRVRRQENGLWWTEYGIPVRMVAVQSYHVEYIDEDAEAIRLGKEIPECPECHTHDISVLAENKNGNQTRQCNLCGHSWES